MFWPGESSALGAETTEALRETVAQLTGGEPVEEPEPPASESGVNHPSPSGPTQKWQRSTSPGLRDEPRWWEIDFGDEARPAAKKPPPSAATAEPAPVPPPPAPVEATPSTEATAPSPSAPLPTPGLGPALWAESEAKNEPSVSPEDIWELAARELAKATELPATSAPPPAGLASPAVPPPAAEPALGAGDVPPAALTSADAPSSIGTHLPPPRKKALPPAEITGESTEEAGAPPVPAEAGAGKSETLWLDAAVESLPPEPALPFVTAEDDDEPLAPEPLPSAALPALARRPGLPNARRVMLKSAPDDVVFPNTPTALEEDDEDEFAAAKPRRRGVILKVIMLALLVLVPVLLWANWSALPEDWRTRAGEWWQSLRQDSAPTTNAPDDAAPAVPAALSTPAEVRPLPRPGEPASSTEILREAADQALQEWREASPPAAGDDAVTPSSAVPSETHVEPAVFPADEIETPEAPPASPPGESNAATAPSPESPASAEDPPATPVPGSGVAKAESSAPGSSHIMLNLRAEPSSANKAGGPEAASPMSVAVMPDLDGEAAKAAISVHGLVNATRVEDVLPWIYDADRLAPLVRGYHETQPLRPLSNAVIDLAHEGTIPDSNAKVFIFNIMHSECASGFPVSAEQTPQGYRIDWQSYVQWRDEWLRNFAQNKTADTQMLFVVLRRTHYFNDDVPDLDGKLAFKLTSAVPGDEGVVAFADRDSELGRSLEETFKWRKLYFPVVELKWVSESGADKFVRLTRIVRPTWRRVGE